MRCKLSGEELVVALIRLRSDARIVRPIRKRGRWSPGEPLHAAGRSLTARPASSFRRMQSRLGGLGGEVQCPEARRAGGALAVDLRAVEVVALAVIARFGAEVFQTVVGH